jgi:hypothetical protein
VVEDAASIAQSVVENIDVLIHQKSMLVNVVLNTALNIDAREDIHTQRKSADEEHKLVGIISIWEILNLH